VATNNKLTYAVNLLVFRSLAIKTGRYTHAKKARDIMEVKGLKEQTAVSPDPQHPDSDIMDHSELHRVSRPTAERRPPSPTLSADEMDEIIRQITAHHSRLNPWTPEVLSKQAESEKHYLVISYCCLLM
jgi:hypothetical protein